MRPLFILLIYYLAAGKDRHMGSYSHRVLRPNEWKLQVIIVMKVIETMLKVVERVNKPWDSQDHA